MPVVGSRNALGKGLLVAQVAISLVLLVGAGLFLRTVQNLRHVDVGFNAQNLALFRVNPQLNRYDEKRSRCSTGTCWIGFRRPRRARGRPVAAGAAVWQRQRHGLFRSGTRVSGASARRHQPARRLSELFRDDGDSLLAGRSFTEADTATAPKVAVINASAARKYFPNENPIGHRFGFSLETSGQIDIVGVVGIPSTTNVREAAPPTMFVPHLQTRTFGPTFTVRTAGDPLAAIGGIREAVRQIDPTSADLERLDANGEIEQRFLQERVFAQAYALFGGLALLLAAIGLFGLMSYSVARRTNEIGIRIALGTSP